MKRREFVEGSAALGLLAMLSSCTGQQTNPSTAEAPKANAAPSQLPPNSLTPPAHGVIPVAFVVSEGTVMIDLAGPREVFTTVMVPSRGSSMDDQMPFRPYAVAETLKPVTLGGLKIQPDYTFANAPSYA